MLRQGSPLEVVVEDDGVGLPPQVHEGPGSRLTGLFAKQLGAAIHWEMGNPGCRIRMVLPAR